MIINLTKDNYEREIEQSTLPQDPYVRLNYDAQINRYKEIYTQKDGVLADNMDFIIPPKKGLLNIVKDTIQITTMGLKHKTTSADFEVFCEKIRGLGNYWEVAKKLDSSNELTLFMVNSIIEGIAFFTADENFERFKLTKDEVKKNKPCLDDITNKVCQSANLIFILLHTQQREEKKKNLKKPNLTSQIGLCWRTQILL